MMRHASVQDVAAQAKLTPGPLAILIVEDAVEVESTLTHLQQIGFDTIIAALPAHLPDPEPREGLHCVSWDSAAPGLINTLNDALPGRWMHYCYNAEYLHFPFCETRKISDMLNFHSEERRDAMLTYVVDLYAGDLGQSPNAVDRDAAHLDRAGYYALDRTDPETGTALDRQKDIFGGLRWRFEEHIPHDRRKIDRVGIFKSKKGLRLSDNHLFSDPEYNTIACPWHNNLTAAICSFRTAKALRRNPNSRSQINSFRWHNSEPFTWQSRQLMDLGLMEPGQWF